MGYGVRVDVRGDFALFTRPEMKAERVSYDLITPSAARGVLEAVFWHPGLRWIIDEIRVLNPIKFTTVRRNEVGAKAKAHVMWQAMVNGERPPYIATPKDIMQRASLLLTDVHYVITAHFEMTSQAAASDNPGKFSAMFRRRLAKGQNYHQPYLGCREFPAQLRPCEDDVLLPVPEELRGEKDLGFMLYDMDYSDVAHIRPQFFRAVLRDGVLDLRGVEVFK